MLDSSTLDQLSITLLITINLSYPLLISSKVGHEFYLIPNTMCGFLFVHSCLHPILDSYKQVTYTTFCVTVAATQKTIICRMTKQSLLYTRGSP